MKTLLFLLLNLLIQLFADIVYTLLFILIIIPVNIFGGKELKYKTNINFEDAILRKYINKPKKGPLILKQEQELKDIIINLKNYPQINNNPKKYN
jgi:hypothetical protein